jgi:hypothetical protein
MYRSNAFNGGARAKGAYSRASAETQSMKDQVAIFRFTLGNGQSIGPTELEALWARACGTSKVSVTRHTGAFGGDGRPTYCLYASQSLADLPQVETRLRLLMEHSKLRMSLIAMQH